MIGLAVPAAAQPPQPAIEQVGDIGASATEADQVSDRSTIVPTDRPSRNTAPPPQLSSSADNQVAPSQLVRESERGGTTPQLYRGERTAAPPAPLSTPRDGRTAAVTRVEGRDRCDPSRRDQQPICRRVIESRADEFPSPEPQPLSAEQRLLIEQRTLQAATAEAAARRLAGHTADPDSLDDQGIASIVLGEPPPPAPEPTPDNPSPDTNPVIEAIVGAVTGNPPNSH
jgi:hypothetical protein